MLLSLFLLSVLAMTAHGSAIVQVRPTAKFCFVSTLTPGDPAASKFGARLNVFNDDDINVYMTDPSGNTIYSAQSKKEDSFSFAAHVPGEYQICLDNTKGTTPRTVSFKTVGGRENELADVKLDPSQVELRRLTQRLTEVREEQAFFLNRALEHQKLAQSTHKNFMIWFAFQIILLAGTCFWQVTYLKSFFETRRVV